MGILSQRLIVIIIMLNITIGFATTIFNDPLSLNNTAISSEIQKFEIFEGEFQDTESTWGTVKSTANRVADATIGNAIRWGSLILSILWNSINPFAFTPSDFDDGIEKQLSIVLILFRSLTIVVLSLEALLIFKNRKSS